MSLEDEGSVTFWLRHRRRDWWSNSDRYDFGELQVGALRVLPVKGPDGRLELKVNGPRRSDHRFHHLIPACDERGLFVGLTWTPGALKLYLNGELVDTRSARGGDIGGS